MKYRIQTSNQRLWYVKEFLIPSMVDQGIDPDDILIYQDVASDGCLITTMNNFLDADEDAWYLQDDVIICSDFKERTEQLASIGGIICGFCCEANPVPSNTGIVPMKDMWFSFPCIYIPQVVANGCAKWFFNFVIRNSQYRMWIRANKYDDSIFYIYATDYSDFSQAYNVAPNLVDHIDYLIGGSIVNGCRSYIAKSKYFEEPELVEKLREELSKRS